MMGIRHYILDGRVPVLCRDIFEWGDWMERNRASCRVGETILEDGVRISTVFLGVDHRHGEGEPLLFETMIFGGAHDEYTMRYSTWSEAEGGHAHAIKIAKGEVDQDSEVYKLNSFDHCEVCGCVEGECKC